MTAEESTSNMGYGWQYSQPGYCEWTLQWIFSNDSQQIISSCLSAGFVLEKDKSGQNNVLPCWVWNNNLYSFINLVFSFNSSVHNRIKTPESSSNWSRKQIRQSCGSTWLSPTTQLVAPERTNESTSHLIKTLLWRLSINYWWRAGPPLSGSMLMWGWPVDNAPEE